MPKKITCTVCHEEKVYNHFPDSVIKTPNRAHRRCKECYTCKSCNKELRLHDFTPDAKHCKRCSDKGRKSKRGVCNKERMENQFPNSCPNNKNRNLVKRCTTCTIGTVCNNTHIQLTASTVWTRTTQIACLSNATHAAKMSRLPNSSHQQYGDQETSINLNIKRRKPGDPMMIIPSPPEPSFLPHPHRLSAGPG